MPGLTFSAARRRILASLLTLGGLGVLLRPVLALAGWNAEAFGAGTTGDALEQLFDTRAIAQSTQITVEVQDLVEDGAVVPVQVISALDGTQSITILAEKNPHPLIAHFDLGPGCRPAVATRIKVAEPSNIIAVVRAGKGLFSARKYMEVVAGGCG